MKKLFLFLCILISQKQFAQISNPTVSQLVADEQVGRYFAFQVDISSRIDSAFSVAVHSQVQDSLAHLQQRFEYLFSRGDQITNNEISEIVGLLYFTDSTQMFDLSDSLSVNFLGIVNHYFITNNNRTEFADSMSIAFDNLYPTNLPSGRCENLRWVCQYQAYGTLIVTAFECMINYGQNTFALMGCNFGVMANYSTAMSSCQTQYIGCLVGGGGL